MAKTKKNSFGSGPWVMNAREFKKFKKVTIDNRKQAIIYGRILYVIEATGNHYTFRGTMTVDPRFNKGPVLYPFKPWDTVPNNVDNKTHFSVYMECDADYNTWVSSNKSLIDKHISENNLYINTSDKLLTYIQES